MNYNNNVNSYSGANGQVSSKETAAFMSKVYNWMLVGLLITAAVSMLMFSSGAVISVVQGPLMIFLFLGQLGLVFFLSARIQKLQASTATFLYLLYSALSGVTLAPIFLAYTSSSIQGVFFVTAFAFAGLSAVGYITKKDLGPVGTFCHMGLWGLIGFGLISMFFPSLMGPIASPVYSIVGVIVFAGLTAYDTQKIKGMSTMYGNGTTGQHKLAVLGALTLYLDFINLFIYLLRLLGGRRD